MKNHQAGFTIVELMVTLLVAGILLAVAVPSFTRMVVNSRIVDQTNELVGALTFGRSEAIKRNAGIEFCRATDNSTTSCATSAGSWQFWILRTTGGTVLRRGEFSAFSSTQAVKSTLSANTITFGSDGLARTGGAFVNAADNDAHYFTVCSTRLSTDNRRKLTLGAGSRITTAKESGTCT